jgi:pectinesterase
MTYYRFIIAINFFLSAILFLPYAQNLQSLLTDQIDFVVAADGSGNYTKVQDAINVIPDNNPERMVIFIKKGTYKEKIIVPWKKTHLTLVGAHVDSSIITYNDASQETIAMNTFTSHSMRVDADYFEAINMTISNTATSAQAVALHTNGDYQTFLHCRIKGYQDTYFNNIRTRNYFKDCFMEGAVDFLFGFGIVLFDSCLINNTRADGYMTAAATSQNYKFGFVLMNCRISNPSSVSSFYLGRPWFAYARTVLYTCWESSAVNAAGWASWSGREATCFYREYKCTGPGSGTSGRVSFGKQLTDQESASYRLDSIFSAMSFPRGATADTAEVNTILRRFETSTTPNMVTIARTFMKCGRDTFPPIPSTDWRPRVDTNPVYAVVRANTARLYDSVQVSVDPERLSVKSSTAPFSIAINTNKRITIARLDSKRSAHFVINLFEISGQTIFTKDVWISKGSTMICMQTPDIAPGLYLYRGIFDHGSFYCGMVELVR